MIPFGFLKFIVDGWEYRIDIDEDPDDRTRKNWHCLVDPEGVHHWEIDSIISPYKEATSEEVRDIISYIRFQQCRAS